MCNHIVVLAQAGSHRYITCCEHGSTQFAWDTVLLRLSTSRLAGMGKALAECAQVARFYRIASSEEVCVVLDQHDLYQVWLGGVGLCLNQTDFAQLLALVEEACAHQVITAKQEERAQPGGTDDAPIRTSYHLFSIN